MRVIHTLYIAGGVTGAMLAFAFFGNLKEGVFHIYQAIGYGGGFIVSQPISYGAMTVAIDDGAIETTSPEVLLTLSGSNIRQVEISNDKNFQTSEFIDFSKLIPWSLEDKKGEKEVFVRFYNENGSKVAAVSDTIDYKDPEAESARADSNGDGEISTMDAQEVLSNWGKKGNNKADINDDGVVDIFDFNAVMVHWKQ